MVNYEEIILKGRTREGSGKEKDKTVFIFFDMWNLELNEYIFMICQHQGKREPVREKMWREWG